MSEQDEGSTADEAGTADVEVNTGGGDADVSVDESGDDGSADE